MSATIHLFSLFFPPSCVLTTCVNMQNCLSCFSQSPKGVFQLQQVRRRQNSHIREKAMFSVTQWTFNLWSHKVQRFFRKNESRADRCQDTTQQKRKPYKWVNSSPPTTPPPPSLLSPWLQQYKKSKALITSLSIVKVEWHLYRYFLIKRQTLKIHKTLSQYVISVNCPENKRNLCNVIEITLNN